MSLDVIAQLPFFLGLFSGALFKYLAAKKRCIHLFASFGAPKHCFQTDLCPPVLILVDMRTSILWPIPKELYQTIWQGYIAFGISCPILSFFGSFLVFYLSTMQLRSSSASAHLLRLAHVATAFRLTLILFQSWSTQ